MYDFNTKSWGYIWLDFITKTRTWTQTDKMPVALSTKHPKKAIMTMARSNHTIGYQQ